MDAAEQVLPLDDGLDVGARLVVLLAVLHGKWLWIMYKTSFPRNALTSCRMSRCRCSVWCTAAEPDTDWPEDAYSVMPSLTCRVKEEDCTIQTYGI